MPQERNNGAIVMIGDPVTFPLPDPSGLGGTRQFRVVSIGVDESGAIWPADVPDNDYVSEVD